MKARYSHRDRRHSMPAPSPPARSCPRRLPALARPARPAGATLPPVARVVVEVMLKPEIHDPQGEAIASACHRLGFGQVVGVRQGKRFEVELSEPADETAVAVLSQALVEAGALIRALVPATATLEDLFFSLTEGSDGAQPHPEPEPVQATR